MLITCICSLLLTWIWMTVASKDKDFIVNGEYLQFTRYDKCCIGLYSLAMLILIFNLPIHASIFAAISLPYLIVSAITDKKTKLVYNAPFYVFCTIALVIECYITGSISLSVLIIYLFAELFAAMKMFGKGDRAMIVICGTIYFFYKPESIAEALLITCVMILIAEVFMYIQAIMEQNLDGPFKLKESRPFGPGLCLATFLTLAGVLLT